MRAQSRGDTHQKSTKTLADQVQGKAWFQHLVHATNVRENLQSIFEQAIPADFIGNYHVLEIKGAELLVGTDTAAWATRLRYAEPQIIETLQQHKKFSGISVIKCLVMPPKTNQYPKKHVEAIPESAAKSMKAIANSITDPDLKAAMLKLAKNVE